MRSLFNGGGGLLALVVGFLMMALGKDSPLSQLFSGLFKNYGREDGDTVHISRKPASGSTPGKPVDLSDFDLAEDFPDDIKFVKAEKQGNNVVYTGENGEQVVKHRANTKEASRSWVNNNPGNIEYGDFARKNGAIGTDGRFAIFSSPEAGMQAQATLLQSGNYRNLTLAQAIHRYAPSFENNTEAYIRYVEKAAGVDRNTKMADMSPGNLANVVKAMAKHEGWKEGSILTDIEVAQAPAQPTPQEKPPQISPAAPVVASAPGPA